MRGYDPYAQYKKTKVETSSPGELVLLVYDEAIKCCKLAVKAIENKVPEAAHNNIIKVQDIIDELSYSINKDQGGEIAENLLALYEFMKTRLIEANLKKDTQIVNEVHDMLLDLRQTWQEAIKTGARGNV